MNRLRMGIMAVTAAASMGLTPTLGAQGFALGIAGAGMRCNYRVSYVGNLQEQHGYLLGADGYLRVGPVALGGRYIEGTVRGDLGLLGPADRRMRVLSARVHLALFEWLSVGVDGEGKRFDTPLSSIAWRLVGPSARFSPRLGSTRLRGIVDAAYFPFVDVTPAGRVSLSARGEFGLRYVLIGQALVVNLLYRLERSDFRPTSGEPARREQTSGIILGLGLHLGRP